MLYFKTPRHTAVTALALICLLGAAFWIYHSYTNRIVVVSLEEMLAEYEAIWAELDEWEAHYTAANDSEGLAEVGRLRERWFEMLQGHIDRMEKLIREIDEYQAANPVPEPQPLTKSLFFDEQEESVTSE